MKKLSLFATCLVSSLIFSSCKVLDGYLTNSEPLRVITRSGDSVVIKPGTISVRVKANSENKMKLILKTSSGREVAPINTDFDIRNIRNGDKILIKSAVSGQPFDIEGYYKDVTSYSQTYNSIESCSYTITERHCRDVYIPRTCQIVKECDPRNPTQCKTREKCDGGFSVNRCENVNITRYGQRDVSYYYANNDINFDLNLMIGSKIVGQIRSGQDSSNKQYTYQGSCR